MTSPSKEMLSIWNDEPLERGDLPSASKIESYVQCRGKYLMEKEFPSPPDDTNDDAERGNRIHARLSGAPVFLDGDEYETYEECVELATRAYKEWLGDLEDRDMITLQEKRLWLRNDAGEKIFSGQADLIRLSIVGSKALIIDYKTGRSDTAISSKNEQLRSLAVLVYLNTEVTEISVTVIQPLAQKYYELCVYDFEDLFKSRVHLELLLQEINDEKSKTNRTPGACCKYCSAKLHCPQAMNFMKNLEIPSSNIMTAEQLSELLDRCAVAEMMIKQIRKTAKETILQGIPIPNYEMKDGAKQRKIPSSKDAWLALRPSMTADEFISCCSVKIGSIDEVIKEKMALTGDELKDKVSELLGSAMLEERNESSLKRLK